MNSDLPLKLIKAVNTFAPEPMGKKDILITGNIIGYIEDIIDLSDSLPVQMIDGKNKIITPGFIDGHVHILGGGGEGGFKNRTPEIMLSDLTSAGITTVVGCLGTDSATRTMSNLVAKARGLTEEGITCFCYTGNYRIPVTTLTGSVIDDLVHIDRIVGVGEIALSDHRSAQPTFDEMAKIAADARVGGILSGKAGIVNVHVGKGKRKLSLLEEIADKTEIPITQFLPTHLGRTPELFGSAIQYAKKGGLVDFTTSTPQQILDIKNGSCDDVLKIMLDKNVPIENISFSSDAQGSLPNFDSKGIFKSLNVGKAKTLFEAFRNSVIRQNIPVESALKVITSNPARNFKLENKGNIAVGKDADLVLLDKNYQIDTVIARGRIFIENKEIRIKGTFEQ